MKTHLSVMRAERRHYIGGSQMAVLHGLSERTTIARLYAEKVGLVEPLDPGENDAVYWGNEHEAGIIRRFERDFGVKVYQIPTIRHPKYSFLAGNLDGYFHLEGERVLECKYVTPYTARKWGEQGTSLVPEDYYIQANYYTGLMRLRFPGFIGFTIAALIAGHDFRTYNFDFDEELFGKNVEAAVSFMFEHVFPQIPPEPDYEAHWLTDLLALHPSDDGSQIDGTPEIAAAAARLRRYSRLAARVIDRVERARAEIENFMKDAAILNVAGFEKPFTWKTNRPSTKTDFKAACREAEVSPAILTKHTIIKPGARVFLTPWSRPGAGRKHE